MKEKLFGLLINLGNLEHYLIAQKILIKKISNNFEKFVIIDSSKIYHFPKNTALNQSKLNELQMKCDALKALYIPGTSPIGKHRSNKSEIFQIEIRDACAHPC